MNAVETVRANLKKLNLVESDDWTPTIVVADADKAAEVIKVAISDKDFVEFEFRNGRKLRTNVSTAKKMLSLRGTLKTFTDTEENDTYAMFWKEMREVNDAYFLQFFIDLYETDENLMDTINRIRRERKEAAIERGRKGAAQRAANKAKEGAE